MADSPKSTTAKSESKVAAREQLDQRSGDNVQDNLEQRAKDQEKAQADALNAPAPSGPGYAEAARLQANAGENPAAARASIDVPITQGLMDNMSRRSGDDALEGHFVSIDLNDKDVQAAYKAVGLEDHRGDYGVYIQRAAADPDTGVAVAAIVRLRDETNARVTVPYDALRPAEARGR